MKTALTLENKKLMSLERAQELRAEMRSRGEALVLTNGCFDLLHVGHLSYLKKARALGGHLWIALNGEESVKALKGPSRPVQSDDERAYILSCLEFVDGVVVFKKPRLTDEILALKPDIYVKAGDYTLDTLDPEERGALEKVGAEIIFLPFLEGYSTTNLINKISKAATTF